MTMASQPQMEEQQAISHNGSEAPTLAFHVKHETFNSWDRVSSVGVHSLLVLSIISYMPLQQIRESCTEGYNFQILRSSVTESNYFFFASSNIYTLKLATRLQKGY